MIKDVETHKFSEKDIKNMLHAREIIFNQCKEQHQDWEDISTSRKESRMYQKAKELEIDWHCIFVNEYINRGMVEGVSFKYDYESTKKKSNDTTDTEAIEIQAIDELQKDTWLTVKNDSFWKPLIEQKIRDIQHR